MKSTKRRTDKWCEAVGVKKKEYWMPLWWQRDSISGNNEHLMFDAGYPLLFNYRTRCEEWIEEKYGYIKVRKDLRSYPHGWRIPQAVRVDVTISVSKGGRK